MCFEIQHVTISTVFDKTRILSILFDCAFHTLYVKISQKLTKPSFSFFIYSGLGLEDSNKFYRQPLLSPAGVLSFNMCIKNGQKQVLNVLAKMVVKNLKLLKHN